MSERTYIAFIDDERDLVNLFSEALKLKGYSVRGFDNPLVALEHLYQHHDEYWLIITDVKMSGMNGLELAKSIYELDKEIKIICMSAFEIYDSELNEVPINEFLNKPIHISQLIRVIQKHHAPIQAMAQTATKEDT